MKIITLHENNSQKLSVFEAYEPTISNWLFSIWLILLWRKLEAISWLNISLIFKHFSSLKCLEAGVIPVLIYRLIEVMNAMVAPDDEVN